MACTDASVAARIAQNKGAGNMRHVEVNPLWLQTKVADGDIEVQKIGTDDNPADLLTKHLNRDIMDKHVIFLGYTRAEGRHEIAPTSEYNNKEENKVRRADMQDNDTYYEGEDPWQDYAIHCVTPERELPAGRDVRENIIPINHKSSK